MGRKRKPIGEKEIVRSVEKAIKTNNEWYSLRSILGYQRAIFYILLGAREAGKSFAVMDFCLKEYFKKGKTFTWIRLTEGSTKKLKTANGHDFIDAPLLAKYNIDPKKLKVKGDHVFYDDKEMAKILALSTFYNDKGVANFDDKEIEGEMFAYNIVCDEFQREKNERNTFDICYAFVNQLENLVRHKTNVRVFLIGNTVEDASDILTMFNFIPETFGRYKLKKKRCVIDYIPPSEKYLKRRAGSIADILAGEASTFTNVRHFDRSQIYKGRLITPRYIIKFDTDKKIFTVWDNNVIAKYNGEKKIVIPMRPLMNDNSVFSTEYRDKIILMNFEKKYKFRDLLTQKLFDKCMKEVKGIK